jgi:hypothetical protein
MKKLLLIMIFLTSSYAFSVGDNSEVPENPGVIGEGQSPCNTQNDQKGENEASIKVDTEGEGGRSSTI